jgi:hypothetical protein
VVTGGRLALLVALLGFGCATELVPRTELVLVADTDVPFDEIEMMGFEVTDRAGNPYPAVEAKLSSSADLPITFALNHAGGDKLGPVTVSSFVESKGRNRLERSHSVSFQPGKTLVVPLHLSVFCAGNSCGNEPACFEQDCTCTERGCEAQQMGELEPWTGTPPSMEPGSPPPAEDAGMLDASMPIEDDAGMSVPEDAGLAMLCGGESYDLTDDEHCGSCENDCTAMEALRPHVVFACVNQACRRRCELGWDNCDGKAANGCETDLLNSKQDCGSCGNRCMGPLKCMEGVCQ